MGFVEVLVSQPYRGKQSQVSRCLLIVGSRWRWVADGGVVL